MLNMVQNETNVICGRGGTVHTVSTTNCSANESVSSERCGQDRHTMIDTIVKNINAEVNNANANQLLHAQPAGQQAAPIIVRVSSSPRESKEKAKETEDHGRKAKDQVLAVGKLPSQDSNDEAAPIIVRVSSSPRESKEKAKETEDHGRKAKDQVLAVGKLPSQDSNDEAVANHLVTSLRPPGTKKMDEAAKDPSNSGDGVTTNEIPYNDIPTQQKIGDRHLDDDGRLDVLDLLPKMYRPVSTEVKVEPAPWSTEEYRLAFPDVIQLSSDDDEEDDIVVLQSPSEQKVSRGREVHHPSAERSVATRPKVTITLDVTCPQWPVPLPFESLPPDTRTTKKATRGRGADMVARAHQNADREATKDYTGQPTLKKAKK